MVPVAVEGLTTVSTRCSRARGPAAPPSLVTWPTSTTGTPWLLASPDQAVAHRPGPDPGADGAPGAASASGHRLDRVHHNQHRVPRPALPASASAHIGGRCTARGAREAGYLSRAASPRRADLDRDSSADTQQGLESPGGPPEAEDLSKQGGLAHPGSPQRPG